MKHKTCSENGMVHKKDKNMHFLWSEGNLFTQKMFMWFCFKLISKGMLPLGGTWSH